MRRAIPVQPLTAEVLRFEHGVYETGHVFLLLFVSIQETGLKEKQHTSTIEIEYK